MEWDKPERLAFEREMLGLYVSDHPLFGIEHVLTSHADTSIASLMGEDGKPEGANVTIAGLITGLQVKRTKKGDLWAIVTVEDLEGAIECLFFPSAYMTVSTMLTHDAVVVVKGRVNRRDETPSIYASELTLPDISEGPRGPVVVTIDTNRATTGKIEELKSVLASHPGSTEVHVRLSQPGRSVLMRLEDTYRVSATESLFGDLKVILGARCLASS
jgi:DNA polymerase-3 subunit alpha